MEVMPRVELINPPNDPITTIYCAAKQCYSSEFIMDVMRNKPPTRQEKIKLVLDVIKSGHITIVENVSYTFAIDGISRSDTHQHVRHRMASYAQQSQRYCDMSDDSEFEYIIPPSIKNNPIVSQMYTELMSYIDEVYNDIKTELSKDLKTKEEVNQDARYVLPNACSSKLITTMNISSLYHFFGLRCCNRAQWEIRHVANEMLRLCKGHCFELFKNAGPKCITLGKCPEGSRTCGKFNEIMKERI